MNGVCIIIVNLSRALKIITPSVFSVSVLLVNSNPNQYWLLICIFGLISKMCSVLL